MPERLRRLFETEDVLERYGSDWKELPWALMDMEFGDEWGGDLTRPPPPNDPRTHLPEIFKFSGWDCYELPDFDVHFSHPPQYPSELVRRLRRLHDSGVALQKQDDIEYVVVHHMEEKEESDNEASDEYEGSDDEERDEDEELENEGSGEEEESGNEESDVEEELDKKNDDREPERYDTLEQANDRAMQILELDGRSQMEYSFKEPDESKDEYVRVMGLHSFVHKDRQSDLLYGDEGLTWDIDDAGCVKFHDVRWRSDIIVKKRKKGQPAESDNTDQKINETGGQTSS